MMSLRQPPRLTPGAHLANLPELQTINKLLVIDKLSESTELDEVTETSKMPERTGNVLENKGAVWKMKGIGRSGDRLIG
jgi:hypothetical protein